MPYKDIEKRREHYREWQRRHDKRQYLRHKEVGLCSHCNRQAILGQTLCILHNYTHSQSKKKWYQAHRMKELSRSRERKKRLESEGRCGVCGVPLIKGEGKRCVNCNWVSAHPRIMGLVKGVFNEAYYCSIRSKS